MCRQGERRQWTRSWRCETNEFAERTEGTGTEGRETEGMERTETISTRRRGGQGDAEFRDDNYALTRLRVNGSPPFVVRSLRSSVCCRFLLTLRDHHQRHDDRA